MEIQIYTIGHSNHPFNKVVAALAQNGVEHVVDVRSSPFSKHASQFNHKAVKQEFPKRAVKYTFMGDSLGGLPKSDEFKNSKGEPDYEKMAADKWFKDGIEWLLKLAEKNTVCLLCAEEDPAKCHRSRLLAPRLEALGATVVHIRADGSTETQRECEKRSFNPKEAQMDLFE